MFQKVVALVSLVVGAFFLSVGVASADNYVPPAVTSPLSLQPVIQVLGTSNDLTGQSLSYTGTGFNVGGVVLIGAIVLLIGIGLTIVGARMSRSRSGRH
ncbi:hypothetical protein [Nakamurella sp. PAMC28650]|uniref:hypothetical protein n=1 Tax=Nakamurella sp. PAMC28650 TaxID=2762325 RepID=UPI00164EC22E|nr:hypothetical protein [Nakamurella sp. PAMC28650]QNK80984.1 hypothetical protein H7F38_23360 [Nakamurella sp. PAMC28650]